MKNLILRIIPKSFSKRIAILLSFLAFLTMLINIAVIFFYEYSISFKNAKYNVESQFIIMSKDVSEAIITDDIYMLYTMIEEVSRNIDHIYNIIIFDSKGDYITDAKVRRKTPSEIQRLIEINKKIFAGNRYVGSVAFYISKSSILSNVIMRVSYLAMLNTAILILGALAGIYLSNKLIRPLTMLSAQISKLDVLELPYRFDIPQYSSYETSQLKDVIEGLSTRLKDSIEKIKQQEKDMARSERLAYIGTMSAGLAHELKNPIMSINLILDSMEKEHADDKQFTDDYFMIKSQAKKLVYRINEFLEYSKPVAVAPRSFLLYDMITDIKNQSYAEMSSGMELVFNTEDDCVIFSDKEKIIQVCQILLHNSIEAGADRAVFNTDISEGLLTMKYIDNGQGFADVDISKIMLPFYTTKKDGVGLGLAICSTILDSLGGSIKADTDFTEGASFILKIPVDNFNQHP